MSGTRPTTSPARPLLPALASCGAAAFVAFAACSEADAPGDPPAASAAGAEPQAPPVRAAKRAAASLDHPLLFAQRIEREGIAIDFAVQHLDPGKRAASTLQEGDDVRVRFEITDTAGGRPVPGVYPAAWMDLIPEGEIPNVDICKQKAQAFVGSSVFTRPELDLNVYYAMTLNDDASISVVDPLFGFGGTKMLAMIELESPGEDWVKTADESRVFVSMPACGKVAVIDTASWRVTATVEVGPAPDRVALQPDGAALWVTGESGVTVVDTATSEVVGHVATGPGSHDLAFADDGRWAYVTNEGAGTLSVVDCRAREKVADIGLGAEPAGVAYCPLARMAYATSRGDGTITVVDGPRVVTRIDAEPGIDRIAFSPDGRLGFVLDPGADRVHVLDPASNRIVQTATVDDEPYQVTFSDELAYVRHRGTATVLMLPLDVLGAEGGPVQAFEFPGGEKAPGLATRLSPAAAIVQAPGANAVLVANPTDKTVYFYKEGMAAPMGSFDNYGHEPRAVTVVDRSLRERSRAGLYETSVRLRAPGRYDVVFLLDSPRVVHCFAVVVEPNPELERERRAGKLVVEHLTAKRSVAVGGTAQLRFKLSDAETSTPLADLSDVQVLTNLMPGTWHRRHAATAAGDGVYALDFSPPRPGVYYVYLQCLSRGLTFANRHYLILEATSAANPK